MTSNSMTVALDFVGTTLGLYKLRGQSVQIDLVLYIGHA